MAQARLQHETCCGDPAARDKNGFGSGMASGKKERGEAGEAEEEERRGPKPRLISQGSCRSRDEPEGRGGKSLRDSSAVGTGMHRERSLVRVGILSPGIFSFLI